MCMIENILKVLTLHLKATIINILVYFILVFFLCIFFNIFNSYIESYMQISLY